MTHTTIASELGDLTVVARQGAVVGLYFPGHWHRPDATSFGPHVDSGFDAVREQIDGPTVLRVCRETQQEVRR